MTTILAFTEGYAPGYKFGGTIQSMVNLTEHIGDEFNFKIITSDRDQNDVAPYTGIKSNQWIRVGNADVYYTSPESRSFKHLIKLINSTDYDLLYVNQLTPVDFSIKPVLLWLSGKINGAPLVIAPRGDLAPGMIEAYDLHSTLYYRFSRLFNIFSNVTWNATCIAEEAYIRTLFGTRSIIYQAGNCGRKKNMDSFKLPPKKKEKGFLKIIFMSRITRIKNLDGALEMLHGLKGQVDFHIYGPIVDKSYWHECQQKIQKMPNNIKVEYCGSLSIDELLKRVEDYHLLFHPSHSENFGHVITESFSCGCPVIVSDMTPWRYLENLGVGWDIPLLQKNRFKEALQKCIDMDFSDYNKLSKKAREFAFNKIQTVDTDHKNRNLFRKAATEEFAGPKTRPVLKAVLNALIFLLKVFPMGCFIKRQGELNLMAVQASPALAPQISLTTTGPPERGEIPPP